MRPFRRTRRERAVVAAESVGADDARDFEAAGVRSWAASRRDRQRPHQVALILPMTQNGATTSIGSSLRNAAELAYAEAGTNDLTILVKDDKGSTDGAHDAAQQALGEGAELVLGPLFAGNVREAAKVARAADKPVIGFSTDAASAGRGVYLLSFLIENYVDRIVDYAGQQGKKSYAALVPESDYGNVALAEFQQAAANAGRGWRRSSATSPVPPAMPLPGSPQRCRASTASSSPSRPTAWLRSHRR